MRRVTLLIALTFVAVGAALVLISQPRLLDAIGIGGDISKVRTMSRHFMEDVQFKDFAKAATYHSPDEQETVDIPYLLERLFLVKPEQLDIMEYEILFAKIDSSGLRARVKVLVKVKNLARGTIDERELMLYFHRTTLEAPWYMKLESSLRNLDGKKGKKH